MFKIIRAVYAKHWVDQVRRGDDIYHKHYEDVFC